MPKIPDGAKVPQDRLAKAEATDSPVEVEHNGVTYTIDPDAFDDVEILEMVADLNDGEAGILVLPALVRNIVGPESYKAFKAANRNDKGRVPSAALKGLFQAIDDAAGNRQASPSS